ncbi:hypothetical protein BBJ28_00019623 [Nothophytophthora sp. Chile5]|nr:hypothetical protein BBJ28_00019623 [Nothophytophthora sp. Chile5]
MGEQPHDLEANQSLHALHATHLQPIQTLLSRDLQPFCTLIHQTIAGINHEGETNVTSTSSASNLRDIRAGIQLCETEIEAAVTQVQRPIFVVFEDEEQSSFAGIGVVLRVSRQDSHRVQQRSGELVTVFRASRASGVWFSTPTIDSLGAKWKALRRSYEEAEAALVLVLTSAFQSHFHGFLATLVHHIAELDVLVGFALVSHKHKFVKAAVWDPQTADSGQEQRCGLRLLNVFDPFKENAAISTGNSGKASDGLTIQLSYHEGKTFLLLDGDGEAGEPSILKLLGRVVMLNQLGCFVPCQEATPPVFDAIHLRTGAFDQQLYGYSTFMTEMQEMRRIFATMTPASLVLIEDLCRGTSTTEGLALALSMCLHLMETKTMTCFSSQWRELTDQLAQQQATVTPMREGEVRQAQNLPTRTAASFEKLMTDCDLPPDLIDLIRQELQQ